MDKILIKEIYLPIVYILIGYIIYLLAKQIIKVSLSRKQLNLNKNSYNFKKIETYKNILINFVKCIIIIFIVLSILPIFGVDVSSLLAGLGIVSAVIALAFQDTLKDLIAGISIILENQFAIGDTISIGDFRGEVVHMGLRSTRIRSYTGEVKIISNRNITDIINYSCSYSLAVIDVSVSYNSNLEKVEKVLNELAQELSEKIEKIKEPIQVLGVQSLDDSAIVYRLTVKTQALEQFAIERQIKKEIKQRFDQEKIEIPFPQVVVHSGK